jgi:hypothetical protein
MKRLLAARVLCAFVALVLIMSAGCAFNTPLRQRRRAYTIRTDLDRAVDDIDWVLGLHRPTTLYDETMR